MFGIFTILSSAVFFANSIVILNEERFLNKVCLPLSSNHRNKLSPNVTKIVEFINAIRTVFGIPLIFLNIILMIYELLFG